MVLTPFVIDSKFVSILDKHGSRYPYVTYVNTVTGEIEQVWSGINPRSRCIELPITVQYKRYKITFDSLDTIVNFLPNFRCKFSYNNCWHELLDIFSSPNPPGVVNVVEDGDRYCILCRNPAIDRHYGYATIAPLTETTIL
jgi:hypothetical protein